MTSTPESTATRFVVGESYQARSAGDYDCVWTFTVESRTAHFVTLRQDSGESMRVGVREWRGVETALPFGRYSMSPSISAERPFVIVHQLGADLLPPCGGGRDAGAGHTRQTPIRSDVTCRACLALPVPTFDPAEEICLHGDGHCGATAENPCELLSEAEPHELAEPMEMLSAVERRCVVDLVGIIHAARGDHPALAEVRRLTTQELDKLTATLRDRGVDVEALLDQADEIIEAEAAR